MQEPPADGSGETLVKKLSEASTAARKLVAKEEGFKQLAEFLDRAEPIAAKLSECENKSVDEVVELLLADLQTAQELITTWTNRSRIYLLTHCRSIAKQLTTLTHGFGHNLSQIPESSVQTETYALIEELARDMQQAHYAVNAPEEQICRTLENEKGSIWTDVSVQRDLLMDIARMVGVDALNRNPSVLKKEIDLLRNDVHNTNEPYDLHMMDVIGNIYDNYVQSNDHPSPSSRSSRDGSSTPMHREYRKLEPLYEAFVCPLTKQVMQDPVTLESGQTYERAAIERWLEQCRENGQEPVCPVTGQPVTAPPKPSIALRNTIEEWTARNDQAHIEIATSLLSADSPESDVVCGLKDLQALCEKNKLNKYRIRAAGLLPLIVDRMRNGGPDARIRALVTLRILAEDDDDNKLALAQTNLMRSVIKCLSRKLSVEREQAVALLYELSKSAPLCEAIGDANGAILILVGMTSSDSENAKAAELANKTLNNLEGSDNNVRQMAENGRLQPLLTRLVEGPEEVRIEMADDLAHITLTTEGKARAAEAAADVLVQMLGSNSPPERASALRALRSLSSLDSNGDILIEAGVLPPLMRDLFLVGTNTVPMKLKEVSATTLANVVCSSGLWENVPIDADGNTLTSELIIHNFLHLISNTGPAIECKLLQVSQGKLVHLQVLFLSFF
jgi:hypothetical protein